MIVHVNAASSRLLSLLLAKIFKTKRSTETIQITSPIKIQMAPPQILDSNSLQRLYIAFTGRKLRVIGIRKRSTSFSSTEFYAYLTKGDFTWNNDRNFFISAYFRSSDFGFHLEIFIFNFKRCKIVHTESNKCEKQCLYHKLCMESTNCIFTEWGHTNSCVVFIVILRAARHEISFIGNSNQRWSEIIR